MSDPSPSDAAEAGPTTSRLDELIEELRVAHAPDATPQLRYATAVNITRALVGTKPPAPDQRNASPPPPPAAIPTSGDAGVHVDTVLNALSSMPREQLGALAGTVAVPLLEYLTTRARSFFAHSQPTYLSRPAVPRPPPTPVPTQPTRAGRRS
jgi:hypothetical protein